MGITTNNEELCHKGLAGLYYVDDPEIGLNVVDLGLIYQLLFYEEDKKLNTTMTLTTQFCPMGESITSSVTQALQDEFPDWEVDVELTFEPPWDYSKISAEGRQFLGMD